MRIEFDMNLERFNQGQIVNQKILKGGATALFMANTWEKLYHQFVPYEEGVLSKGSVSVQSEGLTSASIRHNIVYAKYQYYGTNFNFKKAGTTAKWDETAKKAGKADELVRAVEAYLGV